MDVALRSDAGCVRDTNEDCALFVNPNGTDSIEGPGVLAMVADGVGGQAAGEVASRMATELVRRTYFSGPRDPRSALARAFAAANRAIHEAATREPGLRGMATTGAALALRNGMAYGAHVGDSRLYRVRDGKIRPLTRDHSLVADLLARHLISEEEARSHAERNVILRALGSRARVEAEVWKQPLALDVGDRFVLSTDGLHDLVLDEEVLDIVLRGDVHGACEELTDLARRRGGPDNVTVGVLAIRAAREARRELSDTRAG